MVPLGHPAMGDLSALADQLEIEAMPQAVEPEGLLGPVGGAGGGASGDATFLVSLSCINAWIALAQHTSVPIPFRGGLCVWHAACLARMAKSHLTPHCLPCTLAQVLLEVMDSCLAYADEGPTLARQLLPHLNSPSRKVTLPSAGQGGEGGQASSLQLGPGGCAPGMAPKLTPTAPTSCASAAAVPPHQPAVAQHQPAAGHAQQQDGEPTPASKPPRAAHAAPPAPPALQNVLPAASAPQCSLDIASWLATPGMYDEQAVREGLVEAQPITLSFLKSLLGQ